MISIVGIAIISAVLFLLLKKYSGEYALLLEICSVILILLLIYPDICDVLDFFSSVGLDSGYTSLLLKITGIAVLTQFAADICEDSGESALSSKVSFAGKTVILSLTVPTVKALLDFAVKLIG